MYRPKKRNPMYQKAGSANLVQEKDVIEPTDTTQMVQDGINRGIIMPPPQAEGQYQNDQSWYRGMQPQATPPNKMNFEKLRKVGIGMMAARTGLGFIAGAMDRGRQNQYDYQQQTALGEMNPMPADDFQPNPYSLYAKYGGNLKTILKDARKFTDHTEMDMTAGYGPKGKPMMKKGGYEIDRMIIMRNILPRLLHFGKMGKNYQVGGPTQRLTPQQMGEWNQYLDFVKSKGYEGSEELNVKNKNLGQSLFNEYKQGNPNASIGYDIVPAVQNEMQLLRNNAQDFERRHGNPNADNIMANVSPVDGWFGSKTSQFRFPSQLNQTYHNGQLVAQQNQGLLNGQLQATGMGAGAAQNYRPSIPAGKKLETFYDSTGKPSGQGYVNDDGDIVHMKMGGSMYRPKKKGGKYKC